MGRLRDNLAWLAADRLLLLGLNFFGGVLLVRYLGPTSYGVYAYASSFVAMLTVLSTFGLETLVVRELSAGQDPAPTMGSALTVVAIASFASTILTVVAIWVVSAHHDTRLLVAILALATLAQPANVVDYWFQSEVQAKHAAVVRSASTVLMTGVRIVFVLLGAPLVAFGVPNLLAAWALGLGLLVQFRRRGPAWSLRPSVVRAGALLRDAWPLAIGSIAVTLYLRLDRIMIERILSTRDVGIYSTSSVLTELWQFIPTVAASTALPFLVRARAVSREQYRERLQLLADLLLLGSIGIATVVSLTSGLLVHTLFGERYADAADVLRLQIWTLPFVSIGVTRNLYLVSENLVRVSMISTAIGAAVDVCANAYLLPRYGLVGAAVADLLSYSTAGYLTTFAFPSTHEVRKQLSLALLSPFRIPAIVRAARRAWSRS